jgi:DNA-binding MurR/RpiR family transcriptional regulator
MLSPSSEKAPQSPNIRDLKQLIAERRIDFRPVPGQAMRLLLSKPEIIAFGSLTSVAQACSVSGTTIIRLASRSGYSNFKEMRAAFRQYLISIAPTNQ